VSLISFETLPCSLLTRFALLFTSLSSYSGAKSYNLKFSHSLYNEMACEGKQVDVVAMVPGQVVSGMNEGPATTMMPLSKVWVTKAISSLAPGLFSSRPAPVIIPYGAHRWGNRIMGWMGQSLGDSTVRNVTMDMRKKKMESSKQSKTVSPHETIADTVVAEETPEKKA
jgi:17beta-estradiol 17-dehydrogenase / very-long-chain 3-oxoacyl-CoA reductase